MFTLVLNAAPPKKNITSADNNLSKADEQVISLDKFKGEVLVLYFFGGNMNNWDKPISELNALKIKFKNKKVKVGAITSKTEEEIDEYMKTIDFIVFAKSIDFAVVTDSDSAKKYKVKPPYAYVVAPDGTIYWKSKSLKNISDKINELLGKSADIQIKGTNVYSAKLEGEVTHFKNTTPKLNVDDSQGLIDPGVSEGTTFYKNDQPEKVTPATEADELNEDTRDQIPNQRIEEYKGTPGIKETDREYEERSVMSPNDD
jgi:peroxiredoxin